MSGSAIHYINKGLSMCSNRHFPPVAGTKEGAAFVEAFPGRGLTCLDLLFIISSKASLGAVIDISRPIGRDEGRGGVCRGVPWGVARRGLHRRRHRYGYESHVRLLTFSEPKTNQNKPSRVKPEQTTLVTWGDAFLNLQP